MKEHFVEFLKNFWQVSGEMSPYLLFGFIIAGILYIIISAEWIERHLGNDDYISVFKSSFFGVPLPLCSCSVIPVAASMRKHGASRGATTAFLLSTPQTGIDSIMVTWGLLGPVFGVIRPVIAFISGIIGGLLVNILNFDDAVEENSTNNNTDSPGCEDSCCSSEKQEDSKLKKAVKHGLITLPQDVNYALLTGIVISALISTFVPADFFKDRINSIALEMLIMLVVSVPLYVCSTGSVAIAYSFIHLGFSPGAVLVFLIAGPATNAATITTIWKVMGKKNTIVYLFSVLVSSLLAGVILNKAFTMLKTDMNHIAKHAHDSYLTNPVFTNVCTVLLFFLLFILPLIVKRFAGNSKTMDIKNGVNSFSIVLDGLSCNYCVESMKKEIIGSHGVVDVDVDLDSKKAVFYGDNFNKDLIYSELSKLGITASD
ncbi:MAG: SO_0444 family Cu/Zn efflux transporter [Planctomycetota bacterium]|jgi:uncharacterized membrane protein YraQ (UPF0718 family)/copper chaperone CopZ